MNRLAMSSRITVVEDPDKADAGLTGVVGTNIYGVADASAFRLTTKDGRILWAGEHSTRGPGSHSSKMADNIANKVVEGNRSSRQGEVTYALAMAALYGTRPTPTCALRAALICGSQANHISILDVLDQYLYPWCAFTLTCLWWGCMCVRWYG
jgi:hypothetical protein